MLTEQKADGSFWWLGSEYGSTYISATGGTESTSGDYKIHVFNSSGNFVVTQVGNDSGGGAGVSYVVVAGGGGAGGNTHHIQGGGEAVLGGLEKTNAAFAIHNPLDGAGDITLSAQTVNNSWFAGTVVQAGHGRLLSPGCWHKWFKFNIQYNYISGWWHGGRARHGHAG